MTLEPLTGKGLRSVDLAQARLNVWDGSVRSSKTVSSLVAWLKYVRSGPPGHLLMVGKTERTLKRNVVDVLIEWLGPSRCRLIGGSGELWILGRRVYLAGANDERAQDRIRGLTLAGAYVDEASTIPESFWRMLDTRLSVPGARLFATTNPDSPNHWLKRSYLDRSRLHLTRSGDVRAHHAPDRIDLARFTFQLADNPHLTPAYVAALAKNFTGLWRRRFILGEWVIAEGAIYESWDPARHVIEAGKLPWMRRYLACGVDYGTTNPFSALLVGLGEDDRLYVVSEWRHDSKAAQRTMTDGEYSQACRAWLAKVPRTGEQPGAAGVDPEWTYVDPSAASFMAQLYRDGHVQTAPADNSVIDGIRTVSSVLASGRLIVADTCRGLIDELPGYSWDDKAAAKGEDRPRKIDDHSCDALRYAVHSSAWLWQGYLEEVAA